MAKKADSGFCISGATKAGQWCTRLWFTVDPGETVMPLSAAADNYFYL